VRGNTISVVLATYNGERYLREQLASIAAQSSTPFELVVTDDASSDGTLEIVEAFARSAQFPVRIHANEANLGFGDNFLNGALLSSGDWIAFCDQDDVWLPEKLATILRKIKEYPSLNLIVHEGSVCNNELQPSRAKINNIWISRVTCPLRSPLKVFQGCCMCVRRELLLDIPHNDRPRLSGVAPHDGWFSLLGFVLGGQYLLAEVLLLYRRHDRAFTVKYAHGLRGKLSRIISTTPADFLNDTAVHEAEADVLAILSGLCATKYRDRLAQGSLHLKSISTWSERRARFYSQKSFLGRLRIFLTLLLSGCYYGNRRGAGFGPLALLKDFARLWLGGNTALQHYSN
jgi:glycosyltransferase involved in cell wall biosynthesis